ncbi:MAG: DUF255 domain-containing protein [Planctomycetota bacterium]|jgi:hypothetical protein
MEDKEPSNHNVSAEQRPEHTPPLTKKNAYRTLGILFLVFFGFAAIVFLTQNSDTIDWIEDYQTGTKLAKQQNKPIFLAFYKSYIPTNTLERIYADRRIKNYIEARFVPILIDADKYPEIAKRYNVSSYPAHYIKQPDSNETFGPIGHRPPLHFISDLKGLTKEMGLPYE